jgi:hypothetical protein
MSIITYSKISQTINLTLNKYYHSFSLSKIIKILDGSQLSSLTTSKISLPKNLKSVRSGKDT